ncbi:MULTISPECIES: hypothetical protein [unclassified Beijerinckia]|uniref:hypothetical protein n=1 Tax=unclassified Beijerinckia TaxID=2638183 RepID=UPI0008957F30|nr:MULTISPECIES: hypothetical protein [unclassified Beijerinckia]MDH7796395.1 hypothetical protein [Beijerinckia sp. GAS462]SEC43328.1 hypothetical protein SAMN05443249_2678 [Beijerinckia sp. 28-YEA-48]
MNTPITLFNQVNGLDPAKKVMISNVGLINGHVESKAWEVLSISGDGWARIRSIDDSSWYLNLKHVIHCELAVVDR